MNDHVDQAEQTKAKLREAIDMASASGVPNNMLASVLTGVGWPADLVNPAVYEYLKQHTAPLQKTDFKSFIKKYQRRAWGSVIFVVFVSTIQAGFALLEPWPFKLMADSAFGNIPAPGPLEPYTGTPTIILFAALMSIAVFILGAAFSWFSDFLLLKIGFTLNKSIKNESFRHILHLPLYHQERLAKGDYVYRQNVVTNSLSDLVLDTTSSIIASIIMILGILVIMVMFNPILTLISVVLMPLLYLTMKLIGPHLGQYAQELTELNSKTASAISEAIDNAETVQTFTLEKKQSFIVNELWDKSYVASRKSLMWGNLLQNSNSLLIILATSIVMYFGGSAALEGKMTFGELFIFMTYMGYLLGPVESLVNQITSRFQKKIDVNRIYEVLSDHEGVENLREDRGLPQKINGAITFRNVSYSYVGQKIFDNLNLRIEPGEKVGIIGPSGGGKSTILKLLPLFIEPDAGQIYIDDYDIQSVSMSDLRRKIGWVGQNPQLFTGSIADNLYDGDIYRQISSDELRYAIDVANVSEFAIKLPLGINSPVGENGSSLSGGQRQRVSIARALIKNAPILCLDEPTAALDAKSENYVRDSLSEIIQDKTVLMVTHRRSLLALMNTIYVLENGVLTNVNELGGLDYYLQILEGKTQAQVEAEIAEDQNYLVPTVLEQNIGLENAVQTIQQVAPQYQTADPGSLIYDDGDDDDDDDEVLDNETLTGTPPPNPPADNEVVIRLR